jgi:hypothetical protein
MLELKKAVGRKQERGEAVGAE